MRSGIGLLGEGLVGMAGRRTPCARESCNSDSSPEPLAACSEGVTPYGVGAILDGDPGYRFAPPRATNRSSLRDGGGLGEGEGSEK